VSAARCYYQNIICYLEDEPVRLVDTGAQPTGITVFKAFHLPQPFATLYALDECVDLPHRFFVLSLPIEIVVPGFLMPVFVHRSDLDYVMSDNVASGIKVGYPLEKILSGQFGGCHLKGQSFIAHNSAGKQVERR
jgi:hypothetical protein